MNIKSSPLCLFIFILLMAGSAYAQPGAGSKYNIIPYPAKLQPAGGVFVISTSTSLNVQGDAGIFKNEAALLTAMIQQYFGKTTLSKAKAAGKNVISLLQDASLPTEESYRLTVTNDEVVIAAKDGAGMFYGIQTLRQLLPNDIESGHGNKLVVPAVTIEDKPAFAWRGMMLDVSRHFFTMDYLKKFADVMALYKLNKLHLHLTDDQGWRLEIKKYPQLTQQGAWRSFDRNDSACTKIANETGNTDYILDKRHIKQVDGKEVYGGFYTQDEMKDFISYAASKHIEIIPEIDMPGHMQAAVKLFPYLTCDSTITYGEGFSVPVCPCNEKVLDFAKDIFSEIADLFPSKYIHIGGDEVDKRNWESAAASKAFMREKGFNEAGEIQHYFNDYMIRFFHSKGKTMIGWDEISSGGIDSTPVVMFWRTWAKDALTRAVKNNNKVINTADGPLYFDAIPDNHSLEDVYKYNPLDSVYRFTKTDEQKIMGVQANLWSEMIPTEQRADYLLLPRMSALAELGWTYRPLYSSYMHRLGGHYQRLDELHVSYRLPDLEGITENNVFVGNTQFFKAYLSNYFKLHYTTDGTLPQASSPQMTKPLNINKTTILKLALFTPQGRRGDVYALKFNSRQFAEPVKGITTKDGLSCEVYKGSFNMTTGIKGQPDKVLTINSVAVPTPVVAESFGLKLNGYIDVPETAVYSFYLNCNDGGVLRIDNEEVVNNDGLHPDKEKGGQTALKKGLHAFAIDFIEGGGGYRLDLKYSTGNESPKPVPAGWFKIKN